MTFSNRPQPNEADQELLSAYIDNELTASERLTFERRLQSDPSLQDEIEELRSLKAMLRDLPDVAPPRSFTLDPSMVGKQRSFLSFQYFRLASIVATMLFALTLTLNQMGFATSSPQAASQAESAQLYSAEAPPIEEPNARLSKNEDEAMPALGDDGAYGLLGTPEEDSAAAISQADEPLTISEAPIADQLPSAVERAEEPLTISEAPAAGSQMPADTSLNPAGDQVQAIEAAPQAFNWLAWLSGLLALIAVASGAAAYVAWKRQW